MRKILTKIVTLLLITVLSVTAFAGCALITTDTDRDMAQVVATVQIEDDITADNIHKVEMLSAFMSYGYTYVQQYGYTVEATYEMILQNLVQNKIIIQGARMALAEKYNAGNANGDEFLAYFIDNASANGQINASASSMGESYTVEELQRVVSELEKYLTALEIAQAKYSVRSSVNSLIEAYVEEEEDESEKEDETFTARTTPTKSENEAEYEYQLIKSETTDEDLWKPTEYDRKVAVAALNGAEGAEEAIAECVDIYSLNKYVFDNYVIDLSTSKNLKAFNAAIEDLKKNGLIAQNEKNDVKANADNALNYSYFLLNLKSQYESMIVSKYENSLVKENEGKLSIDKIWEQYQAEVAAQKESYLNGVTTYESALESVTEDTFVLVNPYSGYGYVLNLLIGFSAEQSSALSAEKSRVGATAQSIEAKRNELIAQLTVKDQRETWVYSSYGTYANNEFTFDNEYFVSEDVPELLKKFNGKVFVYDENGTEEENADGVLETNWRFSNVIADSISWSTFAETYLKGLVGIEASSDGDQGQIDLTDAKRAILDDLIYAFGTDQGSLGSYLGYVYSPFTSATKYVPEFAAAAQEVVSLGKGAYKLVATNYGYHLIVCTETVSADEYADKTAFEAALEDEKSTAYKYKELKLDSFVSTEISKVADKLINEKYEEEGVVNYNKKAYKDLIPSAASNDEHAGHNH